MTILARRFTIICLFMGLFAAGLTMLIENSARSRHVGLIGVSASCLQPSGALCRTAM